MGPLRLLRPPAILLALPLLVLACGPAASPNTRPSLAVDAQAGAAAWDSAAWDATVAAAKKEGRLVVSGPVGQAWRDAISLFPQSYPEIELEFAAMPDFWSRMEKEREADQFFWDVHVGGFGTRSFLARDKGLIDPVRPSLVLPEVIDSGVWLGGADALYVDKERQFLPGFLANVQNNVFVNRDIIRLSELRIARDLLDPQWKGRIAMHDAREPGAGNAMLAVLHKTYGEEFVRELLTTQDITLTPDYRQLTEWVIRGRYPIAIGSSLDFLRPFREEGLGLNVTPLTEPLAVSSGNGGLHLISRAPHPNAAKLFANWILTRDVQSRIASTVAYNSRRLDTPPAEPATAADPARVHEYVYDQYEEIASVKQYLMDLANELLR